MCCMGGATGSSTDREILPANVKPSHYNVTIVPGLESLKFSGQVSVSLDVLETTKTIVTNANELEVTSASVVVFRVADGGLDRVNHWPKDPTTHRATQEATSITLQKEAETVTMEFKEEIPAGSKIILHMSFTGIHNDQMAGFYRSGYTDPEGNKKWLVVTQFEATDCRRCFPSWDEPNLKATFDITLCVPKDRTALSNMNVISETDVQIGDKTLKSVKFATTPIMSTYLVAMCVGEFDYTEAVATPVKPANARSITCRVYTLKGQKELGKFGLGVSTKTLEFFSSYFDVAYPLPKMDMVAIPDFAAGAMENWGLVTYRESALLYDPAKSSAKAKERVAYVVGHELAHQWFGNLVTMDWWSELWLNEGFATFVGWLAVDHIFPEWNVFTSFLNNEFTRGVVLDSMRSSHPIEVEVKSPSEVSQIFDAISYSKGASVIRMLNAFLGSDKFAEGVTVYLKKHSFGNARTVDLWAALGSVSGVDVASMMYSWTREIGYPVVSVEGESYDEAKKELTLTLSQSRFLSSGDLTAEEEAAAPLWHIPITVFTETNSSKLLFKEKTGSITFPYTKTETSWFKINAQVNGFYRVKYTPEQLKRLGAAIQNNINAFSTSDRIGVISDVFSLAKAGLGTTADALQVLQNFKAEEDQMVLELVNGAIDAIKEAWYKDERVGAALAKLKLSVFESKIDSLGFEYPEGEEQLTVLKRNLVIQAAADTKHPATVTELKARFDKFIAGDKSAFHANLRSPVFTSVLAHSTTPKEHFDAIFRLYNNGENIDEKIAALTSVGATTDYQIAKQLLADVLDSSVIKLQDCPYPVASLVNFYPRKTEIYEYMWHWVTTNWTELHSKLAPTLALLGRVLASSINFDDEEFLTKVERWAKGDGLSSEAQAERVKQVSICKRAFDQKLEYLRGNAKWSAREGSNVADWLVLNGFAQ
ncbi:Aminopeptidase 2 mitochondrial [Boothiomyces sp. JEL0866]|nr:Aminopeptidase 2 mitochondrial [Boothiomyces sp. JEL0866]